MAILENIENSPDFDFIFSSTGICDTAYKLSNHAHILAGDDKSQTDQDKT